MTTGNDTGSGGAGQDYFYMGDGNDTLNGGDGVDVMLGEAGDDTFNPGLGVDYAFMGTGSDRLNVDRTLSGVTVLNDFTPGAASTDVINLTGTGWTSFAQVQANITDFTASGGFSILTLDADTSIWLIGVSPGQLTAGDFILGGG
jgi:Ca2+-binding RTX toxin-like protein